MNEDNTQEEIENAIDKLVGEELGGEE